VGITKIVIGGLEPVVAEPGTHVDVMVATPQGRVRRSFSIVEQSTDLREVTLGVFRVANSRGGSVAMQSLNVGDSLDVTQPLQNFPLRIGARQYVLIAGGIGITALNSMAGVLRSIGADYELHYAARSREAMAFFDELSEVHGERIHFYEDDQGTKLNVENLVSRLDSNTEVYVCGPIRMMDAVRRSWNAIGHEPTNLRYETFGSSGWFDPEEFIVRVPAQGVEIVVGKDSSMLHALESAGVEMLSDCGKGECGLCEVRVTALTGKIDHRDVFYSERQKDAASKLSCCVSRVISDQPGKTPTIDIITA